MTEAMPFLQKYDITFLRPPTISQRVFLNDRDTKQSGYRSAIMSVTQEIRNGHSGSFLLIPLRE